MSGFSPTLLQFQSYAASVSEACEQTLTIGKASKHERTRSQLDKQDRSCLLQAAIRYMMISSWCTNQAAALKMLAEKLSLADVNQASY